MKIGILQCDTIRESLKKEYGSYSEMIKSGLLALDERFEFTTYFVYQNELPENVDDCDAYIISGSSNAVFDDVPWITNLSHFIVLLNKVKKKTLAICFGHQLVAETLGGKVERADCGWQVGIHSINIALQSSFMSPQLETVNMTMLCEDSIQILPSCATNLGSSKQCEYAIVQYGSHFLTLQGHPEFDTDFAHTLLTTYQDNIPSKRHGDGIKSLRVEQDHNDIIYQWFENFLKAENTTI